MLPAHQYFESKFGNDLQLAVSAFKYARYFDPVKINELKPTSDDIDNLQVLPCLSVEKIAQLKQELPLYMGITDGISADVNKLEWWKNHEIDLPKWSNACRSVLLLQPSSAAAERVFSILTNSFSDNQANALEDYIETSVMLQYNEQKK